MESAIDLASFDASSYRTGDRPLPSTELVVIHGTFARGASWTKNESSFLQAIQQTVSFDHVSRIEWSGANTIRARLEGAARLETHIAQREKAAPGCKTIVLGHSHGGSVIAYWLKQSRLNASRIAGAAFISTPFVGLRVSPHWYALVYYLMEALESILLIAAALSMPLLFNTSLVTFGIPTSLIPSLLLMLLISTNFSLGPSILRHMPKLARRMVRYCRRVSTADFPSEKALFVRITGDEAAAALSTSQFLAWLLIRTQTAVVEAISWIKGIVYRRFPMIPAPVQTGVTAVVFVLGYGWLVWTITNGSRQSLSILQSTPLSWIPALCSAVVMVIVSMQLLLVAVIALSIIPASLLFVPFGRALPLLSMFIQVSVEPLPWGKHQLSHLRWREEEKEFHVLRSNPGLSHADGYQLDEAIRTIAKWMEVQLGSRD